MTFASSLDFLFSLGHELKAVKWDLDRIRTLLALLGDPQQRCRYIHVAGTNGKGSVCAMLESALRVSGARTGLYTSPHLIDPPGAHPDRRPARLFEAVGVRFGIDEAEGVGGCEFGILLRVDAVVEEELEAPAGVHAEMMAAFAAGVEGLFEILLPDDFAAAVALEPEAFGFDGADGIVDGTTPDRTGISFEPGHK